ncbi:unnamed protein product, partial [Didymodactylos carnosus]
NIFENFTFYLAPSTEKNNENIKQLITDFGGKIVSTLNSQCTHIVSNTLDTEHERTVSVINEQWIYDKTKITNKRKENDNSDELTGKKHKNEVENTNPVTTKGSRHYDIIYSCRYEDDANVYAIERNGNEKALKHLRLVLDGQEENGDDESIAIFLTKEDESSIEESQVEQWSLSKGKEFRETYVSEDDEGTINFHVLEGKIPENHGKIFTGGNEEEEEEEYDENDSSYLVIDQLVELVQPWE